MKSELCIASYQCHELILLLHGWPQELPTETSSFYSLHHRIFLKKINQPNGKSKILIQFQRELLTNKKKEGTNTKTYHSSKSNFQKQRIDCKPQKWIAYNSLEESRRLPKKNESRYKITENYEINNTITRENQIKTTYGAWGFAREVGCEGPTSQQTDEPEAIGANHLEVRDAEG